MSLDAGNYVGYTDVAFVEDNLLSVPLLSAILVRLILQHYISGLRHSLSPVADLGSNLSSGSLRTAGAG